MTRIINLLVVLGSLVLMTGTMYWPSGQNAYAVIPAGTPTMTVGPNKLSFKLSFGDVKPGDKLTFKVVAEDPCEITGQSKNGLWQGGGGKAKSHTFTATIPANFAGTHTGKFEGLLLCPGGKGTPPTWTGEVTINCTKNCKDKDFIAEARKVLNKIDEIKETWDPLDLIPRPKVSLDDLTAKGQLCDCCDGEKNGYAHADIGGKAVFTINAKDLKKKKDDNPYVINVETAVFTLKSGKVQVGLNVKLDTTAPIKGEVQKDCGESDLCVNASGDVEGELTADPGIKFGGLDLELLNPITGKPYKKFNLGAFDFSPGLAKSTVKGDFAVDSCGSPVFDGSICAGPITIQVDKIEYTIPDSIPVVGGQKVNIPGFPPYTIWKGNCD